MHGFISIRSMIGPALFAGVFLFAVLAADHWRDRELRRNALLISPGMQKDEVIKILGEPTNEHFSVTLNSLLCFTSDSFNRSESDCGPVAVNINPYGRVTWVIVTDPPQPFEDEQDKCRS